MLLGNFYIVTGIIGMALVDCHFGRANEVIFVLVIMLTEIMGAIIKMKYLILILHKKMERKIRRKIK